MAKLKKSVHDRLNDKGSSTAAAVLKYGREIAPAIKAAQQAAQQTGAKTQGPKLKQSVRDRLNAKRAAITQTATVNTATSKNAAAQKSALEKWAERQTASEAAMGNPVQTVHTPDAEERILQQYREYSGKTNRRTLIAPVLGAAARAEQAAVNRLADWGEKKRGEIMSGLPEEAAITPAAMQQAQTIAQRALTPAAQKQWQLYAKEAELTRRYANARTAEEQQIAKDALVELQSYLPVGHNVMSRISGAVGGGIVGLEAGVAKAVNPLARGGMADRALENLAMENTRNKAGVGAVGGFAYDAAQTLTNNAAALALGATTGGAVNPLLTMGVSAGGQSVHEAQKAGASDRQAVTAGIVNGVMEAAFEKIPLDNLFRIAGKDLTGKVIQTQAESALKAVARQAGYEGLSEGMTSLAQDIANAAIYERDTNPDFSIEQWTKDTLKDVGYSMLLGGVVGGGMGAPAVWMGTRARNAALQQAQAAGAEQTPAETPNGQQEANLTGNNNSWKSRYYENDGKSYLYSKDFQRGYEIPAKSELQFSVAEDGSVSLQSRIAPELDSADYKDFAKAYAAKNLITEYGKDYQIINPKPITIAADNKQVIVTQTGINDVLKNVRGNRKSASLLDSIFVLDDIIAGAKPESISENKKGRENPFSYYVNEFTDSQGQKYKVTVDIKDAPNGSRYHYHGLQEADIKIEPLDGTSLTDESAFAGVDLIARDSTKSIIPNAAGNSNILGENNLPSNNVDETAQEPTLKQSVRDKLNSALAANGQENIPGLEFVPEEKQAEFERAAGLADKLGARVVIADLGRRPGRYENGVITLNPKTDEPVMVTLAHELTHYLEDSGHYPALVKEVRRYIEKTTGQKFDAVAQEVAAMYAEDGITLDETGAGREVVAEFCAENLLNGENGETFVLRLVQSNPSLFQKLREWTQRVIRLLQGTPEQRRLMHMERLYAKAAQDMQGRTPAGREAQSRISSRYDYVKPFAEQVQDWKDKKIPAYDSLIVSGTPEKWQRIGMNPLPVTLNQTHLAYALNGTKDIDHALGEDIIRQLPEALQNPVAIIASETAPESRVVVILQIKHNNSQVMAAVEVDGYSRQNNITIDSNAITSIYAKRNAIGKLLGNAVAREQQGETAVYYLDKKVATPLLQAAGVQFPGDLFNDSGYIHKITDSGSAVKGRLQDITESQQFKRWFGDWQRHPEQASKVVDKDGRPLAVYRGTDGDIPGTAFSQRDNGAQVYGSNLEAYYLNIKNPANSATAISALQKFAGQNNAGTKARDYLIQLGYDGVNNDNGEYIAFYPEQIKSAADNIGTFDGDSPDSRYSTGFRLGDVYQRLEENAALQAEDEVSEAVSEMQEQIEQVQQSVLQEDFAVRAFTRDTFYQVVQGFAGIKMGERGSGREVINAYFGKLKREGFNRAAAEELANYLYEHGGWYDNSYAEDAPGLLQDLKHYRIYVPSNVRTNTGYAKGLKNYTDLKLYTKPRGRKGDINLSIDDVYDELQANYGREIFPDFDNQTARLQRIMAVRERLRPEFTSWRQFDSNNGTTSFNSLLSQLEEVSREYLEQFRKAEKAGATEPTAEAENPVKLVERKNYEAGEELTDDMTADADVSPERFAWAKQLITKMPLELRNRDLSRVLDKVCGGEHTELREICRKLIEQPLMTLKKAAADEEKRLLDDINRRLILELNIKPASRESAAVQWIREGRRQARKDELHDYTQRDYAKDLKKLAEDNKKVNQNDERSKKKAAKETEKAKKNFEKWLKDGKRPYRGGETVPYTIEDLKREFPNDWERILKARDIVAEIYDSLFKRINESLKRIYPNAVEKARKAIVNKLIQAEHCRTRIANIQKALAENAARQKRVQAEYDEAVSLNLHDRQIHLAALSTQLKKTAESYERRIRHLAQSATEYEEIAFYMQAKLDAGDATRRQRLSYRENYAHHYREKEGFLKEAWNIWHTNAEIDAGLAGISEFTQPNSRYWGAMQQRKGAAYTDDVIGGLREYIPGAMQKIYIDPYIAGGRKIVKGMALATEDSRNANAFIAWYIDFLNALAGKTETLDRAVLLKLGSRRALSMFRMMSGRLRASAVVGNFGTAIAQFFNLPNAMLRIGGNPLVWASALSDSARWLFNVGGMRELQAQSGFITERYIDRSRRQLEKQGTLLLPMRFANLMLEFGDEVVTRLIWFAARRQGQLKKMDPLAVLEYADDETRRAVAGRGVGELPLTQQSELLKLIAPFQVEVNNQWQNMKDYLTSREYSTKEKIYGFVRMAVAAMLMNIISEWLTGRTIGFDPLGAIWDIIQETILNGEDDEEEKRLGDKITYALGRSFGEVLSAMPYAGQVAAMAIPDDETREKLFGEADPTRYGVGNMTFEQVTGLVGDIWSGEDFVGAGATLAAGLALPGYGGQLKKTVSAAQDMGILPRIELGWRDGLNVSVQKGSYTPGGKLRFDIDTSDPGNVLRGLLFGRWATNEGKAYIAGGAKPAGESVAANAQEFAEKYDTSIGEYLKIYNSVKNISGDKDSEGNSIKPGSRQEKAGEGESRSTKRKAEIDRLTGGMSTSARQKLYEDLDVSKDVW